MTGENLLVPGDGHQPSVSPTLVRGVLFVCVANAARSQLAEALARNRFGDRLRVQSAGSAPTALHPHTATVLSEVGIDPSTHHSKSINTIDPTSVDLVVMLAPDAYCPASLCPDNRLVWPLPSPINDTLPKDEQLQRFRMTRTAIRKRLLPIIDRIIGGD